jgi:hypothetical protein
MSDNGGHGLLQVQLDIDPAYDEEFNRWYIEEHFPAIVGFPGVLSGRRFRNVADPYKYLALYDLDSPQILDSPEYAKVATSPWTQRISQHFTGRQRNVYIDITPAHLKKR